MAHRIFTTSFASIYPLYVTKAERKGRTKAEVWFRDAESAIAAGFTDARERRQKGKEQS